MVLRMYLPALPAPGHPRTNSVVSKSDCLITRSTCHVVASDARDRNTSSSWRNAPSPRFEALNVDMSSEFPMTCIIPAHGDI